MRTVKVVTDKVAAGGWNPYRPALPAPPGEMPELASLLAQCWDEEPHQRPSFDELARQLKRNDKGG